MNLFEKDCFNSIRIGLASWKDDDYMFFLEGWSVFSALGQFFKLYKNSIDDGDEIVIILDV